MANSADDFLFQSDGTGAARWSLDSIPKLADIDLQFADSAAEGVTVHAEFTGGAALVAFIFLEHGEDKAFLEFPHAFRIKNIALIHLQNECFQLIFHDASLFGIKFFTSPRLFGASSGGTVHFWRSVMEQIETLIETST